MARSHFCFYWSLFFVERIKSPSLRLLVDPEYFSVLLVQNRRILFAGFQQSHSTKLSNSLVCYAAKTVDGCCVFESKMANRQFSVGQSSSQSSNVEESSRSEVANTLVGIIGFGNYGRAMAHRFEASGIEFCIGTRGINGDAYRTLNCDTHTYQAVARMADIVILAVPARVYSDFSSEMRTALENKIVVDISNASALGDPCNAERLSGLLPDSLVVKAFNTLSAWSMQNELCGASRETYICSDSREACLAVMQLAQDMGLKPVETGRLCAARALEKEPLKVFPEWKFAFWMTVALLILTVGYIYLRFFIYLSVKRIRSYAIMPIANTVLGCMVLLLLSFVFLPGVLAGIIQLVRGTKYSMFPKWLDLWLKARKQLGLFALLFAAIHACVSLILLSGEYYSGMSNVLAVNGTHIYHRFRWNAEISLLFATLSMTVLGIQGVASLPTVNQSMSWREWDFVQSKLGYIGFFFGFLHVAFYAGMVFSPKSIQRWKYGIPHQLFLFMIFAATVMVLKVLLIAPGIDGTLKRIKAGWERERRNEEYPLI